MNRIAFKMKLFPGFADEYKERHDEIWPDLVEILKDAGISDYSIFIDEETNHLFGVLKAESIEKVDDLSANPIMQQWWQFMSDIMETNTDSSPVTIPLKEVFYLA
jgi:L-rhamnose mutarotase